MIGKRRSASLRVLALVLACVLALALWPVPAQAAYDSSQRQTVRVGFFAMDGYHMIDEDGTRSGYGYDVLRLMARYWDVTYEYVGYDRSWEDMQTMLENGEIDLVTSARKTPEREAKFDFSRPIGTNVGIVSVRSDNSAIVAQDYTTYEGMTVALLNGNTRNAEFETFAQEKGFHYTPVYYDMVADMEAALQDGTVDAIVTSSLRQTNNERIIDKLGSSDFYVMVKKGNQELLDQVNYALDQMNAAEGDWKGTLTDRYYGSQGDQNLEFSDHEQAVIEEYSDPEHPLVLLCDPTRYPYSYAEGGEMKGILPDYFRNLVDQAGICYEFLPCKTRDDYISAQTNPQVDLIIDARIPNESVLEDSGDACSAPYITMRTAVVTRRDFSGDIHTVATVDQGGSGNLEDTYAQDAEKLLCASRSAAMEAVRQGKADAAFVYYYTAQAFVNSDPSGTLAYTLLEDTYQYRIVVSASADHALAGILTKCIYSTPDTLIEEIASGYTSYTAADVTFLAVMQSHPTAVILIGVLTILLLVSLSILITRMRSRKQLQLMAQQKAEEMAELAQEAEDASRAKSQFLSNMSHDIRTPMNAIVGMTKLMERDQTDPEKLHTDILKVQTSSNHLLSLINDVLDMSKIESGEVSLNQEPIILADQVGQIDSIIRPQVLERSQSLVIRVHEISHEYLIGDAVRLRQILINLLSNALKYTPRGGAIRFDMTELPCDTADHARFCFTVTDTGYGMTPEFMKHVFEPFTRAEDSVTNRVQGTGLGLAITKNIVDLMGGTIQVESQVGQGSKFAVTLEFPIDPDRKPQVDADSVLLLSDEESLIHNMSVALKAAQVDFRSASSVPQAAALLREKPSDVILLSGYLDHPLLANEVQDLREAAKDAMLIFCCDYAQQEQVHDIREKGIVDGLIARPFFLSTFAQMVNQSYSALEAARPEKGAMLRGMRFLCAEDNALNAEILQALLDMSGASCTIYPNGRELVEAFGNVKPGDYDAILMDIQMPVMNGLDATAAIRSGKNPLGKTIPIIAMTANAFSEDVKDCLDAGMDAHVAKPLDIAVLERALRSVLSRGVQSKR